MQCASSITTSPASAARWGRTSSRKTGLLSRSGETSRTSTSPARTWAWIWSHWVALAEFMVTAWIPARLAAATWSRMRARSGETMTVGPAPARFSEPAPGRSGELAPGRGGGSPGRQVPQPSRSRTVATKYTADLPHPVRWTTRTRRCPTTRASMARHWSWCRRAVGTPTRARRISSARRWTGERRSPTAEPPASVLVRRWTGEERVCADGALGGTSSCRAGAECLGASSAYPWSWSTSYPCLASVSHPSTFLETILPSIVLAIGGWY